MVIKRVSLCHWMDGIMEPEPEVRQNRNQTAQKIRATCQCEKT